jgi:hypothetical protein
MPSLPSRCSDAVSEARDEEVLPAGGVIGIVMVLVLRIWRW